MNHDGSENLLARKQPVATWAEITRGSANDADQLAIDWGADGWGWGMLVFYRREGTLVCDNECMSKRFCKTVLEKLTEGKAGDELPPLLRGYETLDALLDSASPHNPGPDWP